MAKKLDEVLGLLGGVDCGACGYSSCAECAEAIVAGETTAESCVMIDEDTQDKINKL
jgi:Na+-translocating ferredoxin:NAD+ oxidoreductase RNF subunit RnfB